jgi:predicted O-methyltransferase YrrM
LLEFFRNEFERRDVNHISNVSSSEAIRREQNELAANIEALLANADRFLPDFRRTIDAMPPHERGPGIFISEMFFFYCMVRPIAPPRILESGRDLGGSTLLLANCFPNARITSVEFDAVSPHAQMALERLKPHQNIECLFGDSREVLPKLIQSRDPVLIDGPKEFRALKLALRLLRTGKPSVVFLHDFGAGTPWRQFLDRHWPGAFFSDHPEFLRRFGSLDNIGAAPRPTTFACLPGNLPASYPTLLSKIVLSRAISLAPRKIIAPLRKPLR